MAKSWLVLDFETASGADLKKTGSYVYADNPTTEVICLAWEHSDGTKGILGPDALAPGGRLLEAAEDLNCFFVAHNALFERAIWREIMVVRFGWPDIPIARWHDTMAVALSKGLPAKLDVLARALHLPVEKDMEGSKLAKAMSKFGRKSGMLDRTPATMKRIMDYCEQDVAVETGAMKFLRNFQGGERAVWELDQKINDRGIRLDTAYIHASQRIVDNSVPEVVQEFWKLTSINPTQTAKFKTWLADNGVDIPDLRKETVARLMGEDMEDDLYDSQLPLPLTLPLVARRALYLRGLAASASIKKLPAMLACQGEDGRARGLLQYHGAGPGRWAGRILQPHNFPRAGLDIGGGSTASPSELVDAIMEGDDGYIRMVFGEPLEAVAAGLRHALVSDRDKTFLIGDFAQIEARIVLALAGQYDAVDKFITGKPYIDMAEAIFKKPITKAQNLFEYTIGKFTILGCGFGMGKHTFHTRYCQDQDMDFAAACIDTYRTEFAPKVPYLWKGLEKASTDTVWTGKPHDYAGITYMIEGPWLTARLPSGRKLWYFEPKRERRAMPWDPLDVRPSWSHMTFKTGRYFRRDTYGGLLTENVVQAIARDLLVHCMFLLERENLPIVLTVHDETVCEAKASDAKVFEQIMVDTPDWAKSYRIPVAVEIAISDRYKK